MMHILFLVLWGGLAMGAALGVAYHASRRSPMLFHSAIMCLIFVVLFVLVYTG